jgi:hypothetical protein
MGALSLDDLRLSDIDRHRADLGDLIGYVE